MRAVIHMRLDHQPFCAEITLYCCRLPEPGERIGTPVGLVDVRRVFRRSDGVPVVDVVAPVQTRPQQALDCGYQRVLPDELILVPEPQQTNMLNVLVEYRPTYLSPLQRGPQFTRHAGRVTRVPRMGDTVPFLDGFRIVNDVTWTDATAGHVTVELQPLDDRDGPLDYRQLLSHGWDLVVTPGSGVATVRQREGWPA